MPCNPLTCKTCTQIRKYRIYKKLLPSSLRQSFDDWFTEIYSELEVTNIDLAFALEKLEVYQNEEKLKQESIKFRTEEEVNAEY